jgi:hypothetical protein
MMGIVNKTVTKFRRYAADRSTNSISCANSIADAERILEQIAYLLGADPVVEILDELAYRHGCPPPSMMKPFSFPLPSRAGASGGGP